MSIEWKHKDLWKFTDNETFTVEISHHRVDVFDCGCYDSDKGHRWCACAYIYTSHPHFSRFDESDWMFQDAAKAMPLHGGPSYLRRHITTKDGIPVVQSIQVGCDYHHECDNRFTRYESKEDASEVFADAERLVNWLKGQNDGRSLS